MKKMVSSLLMASALLLGAVTPVVANAATSTEAGSTSTGVTFKASTDPTKPVDPTDPTKTIDPTENGGNPAAGLALAYAPSTIDFGTHEIDLISDHKYNANGQIDGADDTSKNATIGKEGSTSNGTFKLGSDGGNTGSNVILEVSDGRGTNAGWALNVTSTGDIANLKGATISLPKGNVTASGAAKENGSVPNAVTIDAGSGTATETTSNSVLIATEGNGAGVTVDALDPANLTLNVAANTASAQNYTGKLNWTLSDAPAE